MFRKLKLVLLKLFLTKDKQTDRTIALLTEIAKAFEASDGDILFGITPKGQLILIEEATKKVICLITIEDIAHTVEITYNTLHLGNIIPNKIQEVIQTASKIKLQFNVQSIPLAFNPNVPIILVGDAATRYESGRKANQDIRLIWPN